MFFLLKAWFPYNRNGTCGTDGSAPGKVQLGYLRLVPGTSGKVQLGYLRLVPSTSGKVQSCLRYPGTVQSGKSNLMSLCWSGVLRSSIPKWLQESKKQTIFAIFSSSWLSKTQPRKKSSRTWTQILGQLNISTTSIKWTIPQTVCWTEISWQRILLQVDQSSISSRSEIV